MRGASDLVITDASLYSNGLARPGEVAVSDGRIAAVGGPGDLRELAGPGTEILSLPGRLVVPGFQDAHVHPAFGGRNLLRVNLDDVATVEGYLERIAAYAAANPDEPWITGGGWAMYLFPGGAPHKEELDRIVGDRPVFLMNRDVHGAWVNSRALEIAGITEDTPDPWDGRIERDPVTGEPTGALHEGAAYTFRDRFVPTDRPGGVAPGAARGPAAAARVRDHGLAGRVGHARHPRGVRRAGRGRRADDARQSRACGGTGTAARSRSTSWSNAAGRRRTATSVRRR